jgi:hypothetical protein
MTELKYTESLAELTALFSNKKYAAIPQINRSFVAPKKVEKNAILFISINPSDDDTLEAGFYDLPQVQEKGFFKKFSEIGAYCNTTWTHWDLLAIRETKQKEVEKIEKQPNGLELICKNLEISKAVIENLQPKLIIVVNTLARKYLGKDQQNGINVWLGYNFGEIQADGSYYIQNEESKLKGIPILFNGMLSGQRALDNGSFERLKWHSKQLLKDN